MSGELADPNRANCCGVYAVSHQGLFSTVEREECDGSGAGMLEWDLARFSHMWEDGEYW